MKRLIIYAIILIFAVWFGVSLQSEPGYMLIVFKHWTIESSLWAGVLIIFFIFFVLYYLLKFSRIFLKSHGHVLRWMRQRRFVKAHAVTGAGLLALEEGAWREAEGLLLQGAKSSSVPVVNYMNAACAAQEQLNYKNRDQYLEKAMSMAEYDEKLAVSLKQARLHLEHHQYEEACEALEKLKEKHPSHRYLLKLLSQAYVGKAEWLKLYDLLPTVQKRRVLDEEDFKALALTMYCGLFNMESVDKKHLESYWKNLPKDLRQHMELVLNYLTLLMKQHGDEQVQSIIESIIKKEYHAELVTLYGKLNLKNYKHSLDRAQDWLKKYGQFHVELLSILARLAYQNDHPDLAKEYIAQSLQVKECPENFVLLAEIYEKAGDEKGRVYALSKAVR